MLIHVAMNYSVNLNNVPHKVRRTKFKDHVRSITNSLTRIRGKWNFRIIPLQVTRIFSLSPSLIRLLKKKGEGDM